ncbi:hypothetical protein Ahy_B07g087172 [Arachis hypogaea]|uniref:SWIM-type domain-containing protein n=1 Tax=Arachis hypogaea TaxID=3818 RepID=A0A444YBS9_ARAHY|nr:hypothetical protein Ahy_B07g087172 [Arachis hypogaea]
MQKSVQQPKPWTKPQAAKGSGKATVADKISKKVKATTSTRSGRQVKATPVADDSESHDSYDSAEDSLYKPPKVTGDSIYSSDSDSGVDGVESSRAKKLDHRKKHRPAADRTRDKAINTDDSSYEDIKSDECSDGDLIQVNLFFYINLMQKNRAATLEWTVNKLYPKLRKHPKMKHREVYEWFVRKNWAPYWSGDAKEEVYKVQRWPTNMVVDLGKHTCSCRFWQLTGMPCMHAISAIQEKK